MMKFIICNDRSEIYGTLLKIFDTFKLRKLADKNEINRIKELFLNILGLS